MRFALGDVCAALCLLVLPSDPARSDDGGKVQSLRTGFAEGKLDGLHGVLVLIDSKVFAEAHYFPGADQCWGQPLGNRQHGADTLHDMRSVSMSVVPLLYGIALEQGLVLPPETPLYPQFPEYPDLADDPARAAITIEDALSMRMGIAWDETLPYSDPRNSEIAMERVADRYHYMLSQPLSGKPGRCWIYNGSTTALIARLIEKRVGQPIDA